MYTGRVFIQNLNFPMSVRESCSPNIGINLYHLPLEIEFTLLSSLTAMNTNSISRGRILNGSTVIWHWWWTGNVSCLVIHMYELLKKGFERFVPFKWIDSAGIEE